MMTTGANNAALWLLQFIAAMTTPLALGALAVALANLRRLWGYKSQPNGGGQQHLVRSATGGSSGTPSSPAPAALKTIPSGNQLDDPLPDGAQDPQATVDCGEEAVSDLLAWWGLPFLPAGVLRQALGGWHRAGLTTASDIVRLLALFKVPSHTRVTDGATAWVEIGRAVGAGLPCVMLGAWLAPSLLHWRLAVAFDPTAVTCRDPWGGVTVVMSRAEFIAGYRGAYVHVDGRPAPFLQVQPPQ